MVLCACDATPEFGMFLGNSSPLLALLSPLSKWIFCFDFAKLGTISRKHADAKGKAQWLSWTPEAVRGPLCTPCAASRSRGALLPAAAWPQMGSLCHPKLSSSLPALFCSPILIQLFWLSSTASLQGTSSGRAVRLLGCGCGYCVGLLALQDAGEFLPLERREAPLSRPPQCQPCCKPPSPAPHGSILRRSSSRRYHQALPRQRLALDTASP